MSEPRKAVAPVDVSIEHIEIRMRPEQAVGFLSQSLAIALEAVATGKSSFSIKIDTGYEDSADTSSAVAAPDASGKTEK